MSGSSTHAGPHFPSTSMSALPNSADRLLPFMIVHIRRAGGDEMRINRMREVLGIDFRRVSSAHDDADLPDVFEGLVAELGGETLGIRKVENPMAPNHPWEDNLIRHLELVATGGAQVDIDGPLMIGPLQAAALEHDGYSPAGVHALVHVFGRALLDAGDRRHILIGAGGRWDQFEIVLAPGIVVTNLGLVVRKELPQSIVGAFVGRRADGVVDHPILSGFVVDEVQSRPGRESALFTVTPVK
ncbi:MAG: hypothetical protein EOP62_11700 [Sphingomonadales bacterium]|nr:MAG: hypothetical protein EOP62_11700 [Sphingomonadales bacterium]